MTMRIQNQDATFNNLMTQIRQLANLNNNRQPRALPSDIETNLKDVKAITLRSGASYLEPRVNSALANSTNSSSRSPKKRKIKRSTTEKGVDMEPASKKNSPPLPGTIKEIDVPDTEVSRQESAPASEKGNFGSPKNKIKEKKVPAETIDLSQLPYPQAAWKTLLHAQYKRFLDVFKKQEINIPFAEAMAQVAKLKGNPNEQIPAEAYGLCL
ncbi:hypothetical protein Dimus_010496, partial [Dionaea muscipula]